MTVTVDGLKSALRTIAQEQEDAGNHNASYACWDVINSPDSLKRLADILNTASPEAVAKATES